MRKREKEPSEVLSGFLNYIDQCRHDYQAAHDAVGSINQNKRKESGDGERTGKDVIRD